jgi:hypothetical protein
MKKILLTLSLFAMVGTASAQWHHHGGYYHGGYYRGGGYYSGGNWVAPLILGGVIGYEINRANQPVVVQQPPVIVQSQPVIVQQNQNCSPWTETQNPDGTITRTRTCQQ